MSSPTADSHIASDTIEEAKDNENSDVVMTKDDMEKGGFITPDAKVSIFIVKFLSKKMKIRDPALQKF